MDKEIIVIDEPCEVGKYNAIYAELGEVEIAPDKVCEILEIPEQDRPTFTVEPYTAIEFQKILQINYDATDRAYDRFRELGYDYMVLHSEIKALDVKIKESENPEETTKLISEKLEKRNIWDRCFQYGQLRRDTEGAIRLVEKKTKSVTNLVYKEGEEWKRYSGPFDFEVMHKLKPEIVKWLDQELQRVSGLSDAEIAGL